MLAACFSILLAIEGFPSIAEQIVVACEGFVARIGRIDLDEIEFFLVPRRAMENRPLGGDDFAVPDKCQLIFTASHFAPGAITGNGEHSILQTPNRHGVRTIWQDEVRGMTNDLCALQRQRTSRLRIIPIETDHDADLG